MQLQREIDMQSVTVAAEVAKRGGRGIGRTTAVRTTGENGMLIGTGTVIGNGNGTGTTTGAETIDT